METRTEERPVAYVWADYLERLQEIDWDAAWDAKGGYEAKYAAELIAKAKRIELLRQDRARPMTDER